MADTYEKDLAQKSPLTVNDFIRVVGTDNVSYKQLVSDVAKKIIENYTGSSLAGSSQSVKSALDSLNSKNVMKPLPAGSSMTISSANARYILTLIGGTGATRGMYIVAGYASSVELRAVCEASSGVVSTSGSNVVVNNTAQYGMNVCVILFSGAITMS